MEMAIPVVRFPEDGDEHRRNILQEILGFRVIEQAGMLPELIRDLINDESPAGRDRCMGLLKEGALLPNIEDAEGNAGDDVVAVGDAAALQFLGELRGVSMNHMNAGVVGELSFQISRKICIQLEKEQL
jgi:hypothetical protein